MYTQLDFYCKEIIAAILLEKYINTKKIASNIKLTVRQVEYRYEQINHILADEYQIPDNPLRNDAFISSSLYHALADIFNADQFYNLSKDERQAFILLCIFSNNTYLSANDLIYWLSSSKSVINNDIKEMKNLLLKYNISISNNKMKGYFIDNDRMNALSYIYNELIIKDTKFHRIIDYFLILKHKNLFSKLKNTILLLESQYDIHFVGSRIEEFIYLTNIVYASRQYDYFSSMNELDIPIHKLPEYNFILDIEKYLQVEFDENLLTYLTACFISSSAGNYHVDSVDKEMVSKLTHHVMSRFQYIGCLHYDDYDELFIRLYSHLRPALYRLLFHISIYNPFALQIKTEYHHFFILVKEALKTVTPLFNITFNDDEIAYLVLHFQSALFGKKSKQISSHRCAIICDAGIGTSVMLKTQLEDLFPEFSFTSLSYKTMNHLSDFNQNFDLIFTTISALAINFNELPVFYTPALLTKVDKYNLSKKVYDFIGEHNQRPSSLIIHEIINIIGKYGVVSSKNDLRNDLAKLFTNYEVSHDQSPMSLAELLKPSYIHKEYEVKDWRIAIQKAGEILLKHDIINKNYIKEMIRNVETMGPYIVISKHVALPHTDPSHGALKNGLSLLILQQPVCFGSQAFDPVKYIFCLSAIDNKKHIEAMSQLISLLENEDFYKVMEEKDELEIYQYILENK